MKKIKKKNIILASLLLVVLLFSLFTLFIKKREFDVAYDFYRRHYYSRLEGYSEAALQEHFELLPDAQISVSIENLKLLDSDYAHKLKHRKGGSLIIRVKKPYESQKLDFEYVK